MSILNASGKLQPFNALSVPLEHGVTMVEASAGTGKTFAITRLILRLLLERKVEQLQNILVVTFTEKATQELVTRIRSVLRVSERIWSAEPPEEDNSNAHIFRLKETHGTGGQAIVQRALASLDQLSVSTIHGFCQRVLAESALESRTPFRTTFIRDETEPFGRAARDWARGRLLTNHENARLIVDNGESIEQWVKPLVTPYRRQPRTRLALDETSDTQRLLADFVTTVDTAFEEEKQRRHLLGFDDLLRKLSGVLSTEGPDGPLAKRIRSKFSAALIDEFQDTDETQFSIFSNAFAGCPLFLIGDPKQSIYRFRGADIHAYLRASALAPSKYTLLENFRSSQAYVRAVETLFTRAPDPFLEPEETIGFPRVTAARAPVPPGGLGSDGRSALEWWWLAGSLGTKGNFVSKEMANAFVFRDIAIEVVRLHGEGLPYKSVAVLVRKNNDALCVKRMLELAHIPTVLVGDADVFGSEETNELIRIATAIGSPSDSRSSRSAMATVLWGSDATEIAATLREDGEVLGMTVAGQFAEARDVWRTRGVAAAFNLLFAHRNSVERLLALPDGERRLTNVRHVVELFHEAWALDGIQPENMAQWVGRECTVLNTPDRRELRLETDNEAVQILTMHKAKGLQFDVVFCPSLWECYKPQPGPLGVFPALAEADGQPVLDLGSESNALRCAAQSREEKAESIRLAYVALTRAVHRCYVAWGDIGKDFSVDSALGHLLRAPDGTSSKEVLDELVAHSRGTMSVRMVEENVVPAVAEGEEIDEVTFDARPLNLALHQLETWSVSSFTALTAGSDGEAARDVSDPLIAPVVQRSHAFSNGFRAFPRGAQAGVALHDIFERLDFQRVVEPDVRDMVTRSLATHGLSGTAGVAEQRVEDVTSMLRIVCNANIPNGDFALSQVPVKAALREWGFDLSVRTQSARRISAALATHGSAHAQIYAPLLRSLRDSVVSGYLTGFVDLAFEHDGRWWLVDWKSNHLGNDDADYAPDMLATAMMHAHYTLQYHLYCLALHRHLQVRQRGYDPAKHWGGVAYVFLRGVTGTGEGGWFRDSPTPALLDALDAALGRRV